MRHFAKRPDVLAALAAALLLAAPAAAGPPDEPRVVEMYDSVGRTGGALHTLVQGPRDTRLLAVYGYARLVGHTAELDLVPDILKDVEIEDGRIFTLHLRQGHRWSDGHPFTAEDFRYWWEDVATNEELFPWGPPVQMLVDGAPPRFEVLDEHTVRYSWDEPNPFFLPATAQATPLYVYMPAHYLKEFHRDHQDLDELERLVAADNARDWVQLHKRRDSQYNFDNPDLPVLQPWVIRTRAPAERFTAVRNPHFHRVDSAGTQLPYIDRMILEVVDSRLVPIKTGAGETDLQGRGLSFRDYTFLRQAEDRSRLETRLWRTARGAHLAVYPNLNAQDPVFRELFRDVRFRRALSLGVNREAISQFLYYGLAKPSNNTILPDSPLWREEIGQAWTRHDPDEANRLLDEIGLTIRASDGVRRLSDGRRLEIVIETMGEDTEDTDVLQLLADDWLEIGVKIHSRPSQRELLRNRVFSGEASMVIAFGIENGIPTAAMPPREFAPTTQLQYQWPMWGQYYETKGDAGQAPELPEAERLMHLFHDWRLATSEAKQEAIWEEVLDIYADQVFTIGLIGEVLQPVAVRKGLRNVPKEGIWNWEPGAQFGIYLPDSFWLDDTALAATE